MFAGFWLRLYYFHVALFPCCTFSMMHFFHVSFFPCCIFSMWHFFHTALFQCCTFSMLHFFHTALFPCRSFFMLLFFHVALFSCCIHVALFSLSMLHSSHVALIYYWKILKINGRQKTQPKSDLTLSTVNLLHFNFDILSHAFCHYIVLNGW